ncbi:MAG: DUF853 family protein [Eubacteriales bacterium]|nr:DUF853 family protein [Eubacteriales bacterium]
MFYNEKILLAKSGEEPIYLLPKMANRHGLIAGATGTGKTVTLKVLAESFSKAGVPVFLADVKGDLAGCCNPGADSENMRERIARFGLADLGFDYQSFPVTFWDIYGRNGLPLRTTISEMGPTMLARLLDLTPVQEDILNIVFRIADDEKLLLLDIKDLRAMLSYVVDHAADYSQTYGNMSKASLNVILRGIVALENIGGDRFFGEPALNIRDWIRQDSSGKGMINILDSQSLINEPKLYSTFLLWMLSELFEMLPEVGDLDRPRLVFFFDEAHLLFQDVPKALLQKIEQVVKLIRSKGVGIYFITQNPKDIPDGVLAQLGNKIQHALHAYTPAEKKGLKAAAESFRENPEFVTIDVLQELGIGEALVSMLQEDGSPAIVQRASILPPQSQFGPIDEQTRIQQNNANILSLQYSESIDRDSAYEFLVRKNLQEAEEAEEAKRLAEEAKEEAKRKAAEEKEAERQRIAEEKAAEREKAAAEREAERERIAAEKAAEKERIAAEKAAEKERIAAEKAAEREKEAAERRRKNAVGSVAKTAAGTIGREVGKTVGGSVGGKFGKTLGGNLGASLGRGILGGLFRK